MDQALNRLAFVAEWYDPTAGIVRKFSLLYHTVDSSIELFDLKSRRRFLNRTRVDHPTERDLYVGNTLSILSRQMTLVDYGDRSTANILTNKHQKTVGISSGLQLDMMGEVLHGVTERGLSLTRAVTVRLDQSTIRQLSNPDTSVTAGPALLLELVGEGALAAWKEVTSAALSGGYFPSSVDGAMADAALLFPPDTQDGAPRSLLPTTATFSRQATCGLIKPHAVAAGLTGKIIKDIQEAGCSITALKMCRLNKVNAEEFFEVYKGVVQEYLGMVQQLTSGACVAMEIESPDRATFREIVGPADPELARQLRPGSLRARYGTSLVENAIHCTDLPEDGPLEVEYFFKMLD